jgi:hypothetical protein
VFPHLLKYGLVAFVLAYCVDYARAFQLGTELDREIMAAAMNPVTRAPHGTSIGTATARVRSLAAQAEAEWRSKGRYLDIVVEPHNNTVNVAARSNLETWVFKYIGQPSLEISRKRTFELAR